MASRGHTALNRQKPPRLIHQPRSSRTLAAMSLTARKRKHDCAAPKPGLKPCATAAELRAALPPDHRWMVAAYGD